MVLVRFSGEEVDMASDSPARSLDEIDLSALRVSGTCFLISFRWFVSGRVSSARGRGPAPGPGLLGSSEECSREGTCGRVRMRGC